MRERDFAELRGRLFRIESQGVGGQHVIVIRMNATQLFEGFETLKRRW